MVKNLLASAGNRRRRFDPWLGKLPWIREWQHTLIFLPGEFQGQKGAWRAVVHGVRKNQT